MTMEIDDVFEGLRGEAGRWEELEPDGRALPEVQLVRWLASTMQRSKSQDVLARVRLRDRFADGFWFLAVRRVESGAVLAVVTRPNGETMELEAERWEALSRCLLAYGRDAHESRRLGLYGTADAARAMPARRVPAAPGERASASLVWRAGFVRREAV